MIELLVRSNVGCEIRWDKGHLAFDVGLKAQIVLWVKPLGGLSDTNPLLSRVKSDFHVMDKGSSCEAEAILRAWLLQSKEPAKQASDGQDREEGLGCGLRDLTDGSVGSAIIAHDVSM